MTHAHATLRRRAGRDVAWLLAGLAAASLARAALNGETALSAFAAGSAFGVVLVLLAVAGGWTPARPRARSI